jgi:hypothetical protein
MAQGRGKGGKRHVRLRVGWRQWRPRFFGLGLTVQCFNRLRLHDTAADDGAPPVAEMLCSTCFHFPCDGAPLEQPEDPAGEGEGAEDEGFADAPSSEQEVAALMAPPLDLKGGSITLRLRLQQDDDASDASTVATQAGSQEGEGDEEVRG